MEKNTLDFFDLKGQVALITGGNRGLGIQMAKALADAGAQIAIFARDAERNAQAISELKKTYSQPCISHIGDVTKEEDVKKAVKSTIDQLGRIDILINSAGINIRGAIEDLSLDDFNRVQQVNVTGSWLMCREATPFMKKNQYGRIINIGSILSHIAMSNRTPYATSKGAVLQLTRALALELAEDNITVNAILPGPFATEMNLPLTQDPEKYQAFLAKLPLGRWGELHEIKGITLFLASPASSFATGAGFTIDGGWTVQ